MARQQRELAIKPGVYYIKGMLAVNREYDRITSLTLKCIDEGVDNRELIETLLDREKYEELAAIKRGYKKAGKPMPMPSSYKK